jgi:hypothetical protein
VGVQLLFVTPSTLLSAAPDQSLAQFTLANRLKKVGTVNVPASKTAELLEAISLKPALVLVVEDCHLYSRVPVCPLAAALLMKGAGSKGNEPL